MTDRRSNLAHWRTAPIRTQPEVAAIIGISRAGISKAETKALRKIAAVLKGEEIAEEWARQRSPRHG